MPRRLAPATGRRLAWAGLALVLFGILLTSRRFVGNDLDVYRRAGARFLAGTVDLYPRPDPEGYGYSYAPGVAALLVPFSLVPRPLARAAWMLATCGFALLSARLMDRRRMSPLAPGAGRGAAVVEARATGALALLLLGRCIADDLRNGNVNVAVLAAVLGALLLADRGRPRDAAAAGALLALATAAKVTPALLALDWALRRRWRALAALAAGVAAVAALPLPRYGLSRTVELHLRWLASQRWAAPLEAYSPTNQSVWSLAAHYGLGRAFAAAACAALVAIAASAPRADVRRASLLLCAALVTANGWPQNLVFAAPLAALLLEERPAVAAVSALAAASTFLLGADVWGAARAARIAEAKAFALVMIGLIAFARLTARAQAVTLPGDVVHSRRASTS